MSRERDKNRKLLVFSELRERGVALGRRQIDRMEMQNKFPKRVALSTYRVAWVADEIDQWIADKIAARSTEIGALGVTLKNPFKRASG